ncbi:MAG TPA: DUF4080 domain-containing protein [Kiritimatiellia bacterium]|nr:DUF4080 domain-containing protein [Kiritimatiellia bacterium]HMO99294.1 DUF4080 domain-containing protein [Kiritimatiellia bacterium]HMP95626.1 DUF4080 domain-containing protein [Kiritimatiellia bacterium]
MNTAELVLATLNARYSHAAFGLRYLTANLGELAEKAAMLEFDLQTPPMDVIEAILRKQPRMVGFGVYIWNVRPLTEIAAMLKRLRPDLILVVGGPEVSHEWEEQPLCALADYVVTGEADETFPALCRRIWNGERPVDKLVVSPPPDTRRLALPYHLYTEEDVRNRVIYVEASRGCPFTCEFCLSSLDQHLNRFPLETLLPAFQDLLDRGVQEFKFVDRTFNLSVPYSLKILEFFLERYRPGLFLHFEMIPDRLPEPLKEILRCFPRGALQFEVGIQTFNEQVAELISRKQHYLRTEENIRWLLAETGAHIHADLIVGLPGEDTESIGRGFDRLLALGPQEIQVNPLKRLRGTPIIRHEKEWGLVFSPEPPYEILRTRLIDFEAMQSLRRFARFWNLYGNSGRFIKTLPLLWQDQASPYAALSAFFSWFHAREGRTHKLALEFLAERLWQYLQDAGGLKADRIAGALVEDLLRDANRDVPPFLRPHVPATITRRSRAPRTAAERLKRQARHAG